MVNSEDTIVPIILGDWNEECAGTSNAQKLCDQFGLVNIYTRMHPNHEKFKTYIRGSKQLDFALAPPALADKVKQCIYEPFMYRLSGDHRGFYFDIPETALFGNVLEPVYQLNGRGFSSKDTKQVTKYLDAVYSHLRENKVFERITA